MSAGTRLLGAGAALVALCCVLPVAGAALGGGLIASGGGLGVLAGVLVLVAVVVLVGHRRRAGRRC